MQHAADPKLVVVDTYQFARPMRARPAGYTEDYQDSAAITALANELSVALVCVHHQRKQEAEDPLDSISGTTGIAAGFDTVLALSRDQAGGFRLQGRGRDVLPLDLALDFDLETARWDVGGDADYARQSDERKAIEDYLKMQGDASPKEIAEATGISYDVVRQLVGKMATEGRIQKVSRGSYGPVHNGHNVHKPLPIVNAVNVVNGVSNNNDPFSEIDGGGL